ncbi:MULTISPECIES: acylphosphatase [Arthrobacter]|uniref:acylphosphatase n=1 Tax=Arthrobacter caoxuetaonis TaxID=2886935 RepID=A0A9X1MC07_9MICC|nr:MULTISPECIES: acylphosphatase [Arthrobacter]MCC3283862.1 acylphosphatase [Arthrobacter caoxuetaonis]MCC3297143.1 acylphosphatase [Arthrobacter caoxuetaonis]MCC9194032.1 acylphosphatase [Arthrobacter sp. zg-Y916]USQ58297.1 acylphosphatase [Arthrobacter caoxuetaonis]
MDSPNSPAGAGDHVRLTAVVRGMVQGVGFRYRVMRQALKLDLAGTVINQADGSVVITAEGLPSALDGLMEWVRSPAAPGAVENVDEHHSPATGEFSGFDAG